MTRTRLAILHSLLTIVIVLCAIHPAHAFQAGGALDDPAQSAQQVTQPTSQPTPRSSPEYASTLHDRDFGVSARAAGLRRQVEMYQWTRTKDGYAREWRTARVDSSGFAPGHDNPKSFPLRGREWRGKVSLDGKPLPDPVVDALAQWSGFRPAFSALPVNMAATFQPEGEGLGSAENPLRPGIGDLRITWSRLALPAVNDTLVLRDGRWVIAPAAIRPPDLLSVNAPPPKEATAMPTITLLFASLLAILLLALAVPIVQQRRAKRVGVGDGGDAVLARRMRVQANFVEYVPMALLLMALLELAGWRSTWLWCCGIALVSGRVLHAIGFTRSGGASIGRMLGTMLTWAVIAVMAIAGGWLALR